MLVHYLQVYFNYKMNNWSKLLSMIAFAYNNNIHANIKKTSHKLLKKIHCKFHKNIWEQSFKEKDTYDYKVSRITMKYQKTFNETMKMSIQAASKAL